MIKVLKDINNVKISVYLKNGESFLGCDTTDKPLGDDSHMVSFWQDNALFCIPMTEVARVVFVFD